MQESGPGVASRAYIARKTMNDVQPFSGTVRFATTDERDAESVHLERAGVIVAELEGIGPSARGRLAEVVAETIERELSGRGAAGPGLTNATDRDARLGDQLFRARRAGATGIALVLGPLRAATGPLGALDPDDCLTLRFLADATRERPLALLLDARDTKTVGYGDPVTLTEMLLRATPAPTEIVSKLTISSSTPTPTPTEIVSKLTISSSTSTPTPVPALRPPEATWRGWIAQLAAARGPQPLAALERLFADAYVPLAGAIDAGGLDDAVARRARDEFSETFAAGYVEAFPTFAATTKRPRMVLDVHDVAARIARLHGARSTRLLMVDAMRWDLSQEIRARVVTRVGSRASLTDELLLWSALPTITMRQLETIARGVDALRAPAPLESDPQPPRTRNAEHVRRMRVGSRELYRLDLVESRLCALHGRVADIAGELAPIADVTAEAIARHIETLTPRTLLFAFGDHGFSIDRRHDRSGTPRQGGASPEEVLVGAFALLVGDVH
jgi:hypothetical protein